MANSPQDMLNGLSTDDLQRYSNNDLNGMSTEGLKVIAGLPEEPAPTPQETPKTSPMDYWINNPAKAAYNAYVNDAKGIGNAITHPVDTAMGIGNALTHPWDSIVNTIKNIPDTIMNHPLQTASVALPAMGLAAKGLQSIPNIMPPIYNDALVSNTTKSMVGKVQSVLQPIRDAYKGINEPFKDNITDSETFQKALSVVPKSIRQDFIDAYGTGVVDSSGKPMTTVGNLHKMELELKDFINQPQYGAKINAAEFNVAEAAKKLKDIRLSQLPDSSVEAIKSLDRKFGPAITASNELLPKLADRNGVVNTKFLYDTFNNPSRAGMRDYMSNLKDIGIDINPEINIIRGWVARQGEKKFIKGALDKVPGLSVLGYGIKH